MTKACQLYGHMAVRMCHVHHATAHQAAADNVGLYDASTGVHQMCMMHPQVSIKRVDAMQDGWGRWQLGFHALFTMAANCPNLRELTISEEHLEVRFAHH